ncbi:MAG: hypothetical protein JWR18_1112 [Segetibacter sp.]|nr:hypothetical protein [Segetibacter sp.]
MKKVAAVFLFISGQSLLFAQPNQRHDLKFDKLATVWDEAIPLGNGMLGALVWQKNDRLRLSLDQAELWDMRPMKGLHRKEFSYEWVHNQVLKKDYKIVQQYFDQPYDKEPAPSKIPGGSLEFDSRNWGTVQSVELQVKDAVCIVKWSNGVALKTFVHATQPIGWFRLENLKENVELHLNTPKYEGIIDTAAGGNIEGDDLIRLGYKQGRVTKTGNSITYKQQGWDGFTYEISVRWKRVKPSTLEGIWSISSQYPNKKIKAKASEVTSKAMPNNYSFYYSSHANWWKNFWNKSSIHVSDSLIEKQWYLEQYKFGSASRRGAPPISLQAVWTADNGRLPPWKGDYHHDLNTQLSYWPSYSGNHLEEALAYYDHLDENKANYKRYTKLFFGKEGLAVPGVTTLDGTEMGGWIQYSLSPTVSSWLGQHYYLQWRYSMDKVFLKNRAYPWIKEVAIFLENITTKDDKGFRKLPISASPEINNNSLRAWFLENTNYDLSLMKFTFTAAAELANELGLKAEAARWKKTLSEFGDYALTEKNELMFAPSMAYNQSHRHLSNMMAIHPLGLIKWEDGPKAQAIIKNSIELLDKIGPKEWCGYSYSWLANMKARAKDGEGAAKALDIFVKAFCSPNSFHLNGDQTKSGYSSFTYRPFTLEGNFAFAAGLQEMLLQSYAGFIEVLPAVPASWNDITFNDLRAEGAFLVSAKKVQGRITEVSIAAEKGGKTRLKLPFTKWSQKEAGSVKLTKLPNDFVDLSFAEKGKISLMNNE